jgi:hypothetical protein
MKTNSWTRIGLLSAVYIVALSGTWLVADGVSPSASPPMPRSRAVEARSMAPGEMSAKDNSPEMKVDAVPPGVAGAANLSLTADKLQQMLVNLGCEVSDIGGGAQQVHSKRNGWDIYLKVNLSTDSNLVWFSFRLPDVSDPDSVPSSVWTAMLSSNYTDGLNFALAKPVTGPATIYLQRSIPNVNVTPMLLRQIIDSLVDSLVATQNLWSPNLWPKAAPATAPAAK